MAAALTLIAAVSHKLQDTTDGDVVFTKAERELLKGSHTVSITVKYGRKQMAFSVIRVGLTRDFIFRQITGPWSLEEVEFDLYEDKVGKVRLSDDYLLIHASPIVAYVKASQIGFSEFSKAEALAYAGIAAGDDLKFDSELETFPDAVTIPDDDVHLTHAIDDLKLKYELYDPIESGCEYTKREFISPILALSAKHAGVKLACEEQIEGSKGKGPVDWVAKFQQFHICITEGKKDNLDKGVYQNLAQLTAASETMGKRLLPVDLPMYGVATTYSGWVFVRLDPEPTDSSNRLAARSHAFDISRAFLAASVKAVAEQLVGILLSSQKKVVEDALGGGEQKKTKRSFSK